MALYPWNGTIIKSPVEEEAQTSLPPDDMASVTSVPRTLGALLLGGLFATFLSGAVTVQSIVYIKLYPQDIRRNKALVGFIWLLDISHTCLIWVAVWDYMINGYGNMASIDHINSEVASTVVLTAILTFCVHCFLAHRIWKLSQKNWYLTIPILFLAVLRLASACATTAEMIKTESFVEFRSHFKWLFTLGLGLSTVVDILITSSLFYLLQMGRQNATTMGAVIDSLIRYAFETGALTCAGTVVSMLCWVTMHGNLIFLGLHFVIAKFYATSLLVTLNARQTLRHTRSPSNNLDGGPLRIGSLRSNKSSESPGGQYDRDYSLPTKGFARPLEISVERHVEQETSIDPISFKMASTC